jgi:hypothetical protein
LPAAATVQVHLKKSYAGTKKTHTFFSPIAATHRATLAEKARKFIKGKTTYSDLVRELGEPDRKFDYRDGIWADYEGYISTSHGISKVSVLRIVFKFRLV